MCSAEEGGMWNSRKVRKKAKKMYKRCTGDMQYSVNERRQIACKCAYFSDARVL
jgi:hypothetical protein